MPKRKVLSFDVGIINLGYCLMEIDDAEKTFDILKWNTLDLASGRTKCSFIKNGKEACNKIASRNIKLNQHNSYCYCKSHIDKAMLNVKQVNVKLSPVEPDEIDKCSMCNKNGEYCINMIEGKYCKRHCNTVMSNNKLLCSVKKCKNIVTNGLYLFSDNNNIELSMGWCDEHYDTGYRDYVNKKTKKISNNSNKISLTTLGISMYQQLDDNPDFMNVDDVLVENQPTFINPTMKSVSAILFSYFIMRAFHERNRTGSTIKNILFCSPSNKIKVGGHIAVDRLESAEKNNERVYKVTKKLSVQFCKAIISDRPEYLEMIESHKKQDDMADAFLQCFIMNFGPKLPNQYEEKIKNINLVIAKKKS